MMLCGQLTSKSGAGAFPFRRLLAISEIMP
jgi:hypothetical protein